jgi:IS30 family transposase
MARHAEPRVDHDPPVRFRDPHGPRRRGTDGNADGLPRQYFPEGTDLAAHGPDGPGAMAAALDGRPRRTPAWRTPAEAPDALPTESQDASVATTGRDRPVIPGP